jgi:hypothetical protein
MAVGQIPTRRVSGCSVLGAFSLLNVNLLRCVALRQLEQFCLGKSRYESFTKRHLFMLVAEQHRL